jgi:hypothetical protein
MSMPNLVVGRSCDRALQLDGAAGRDDRRGEQRRRVAGARRKDADRGGGSTDGAGGDRRPAASCRAAAGRSTAAAADTDLGENPERSERGHERRQLPADALDLTTERPAAVAVAQVPPSHRGRAHAAVVGDDQCLADLRARRVARLRSRNQADPSADEQGLDGGDGDAEGVG